MQGMLVVLQLGETTKKHHSRCGKHETTGYLFAKTLLRDIPTPTEWLLRIAYEQTLSPVLWQHEIENWTWRKVKLQHIEVFEWFTISVVSRSIQCQQLFWQLGWFLPYSIFPDWNPGINQTTSGQYSAEGAAIGFPINLSLCLVKCHSAPFAFIHPEHRRAGSCARPPFRLHFLSKFETVAKFMFVPLQVCGGPPPLPIHHPAHHQEQTAAPVLPPGHSAEKVTTQGPFCSLSLTAPGPLLNGKGF